jgi:predicted RNase H-like nuclease (RuvC/YqgF family)
MGFFGFLKGEKKPEIIEKPPEEISRVGINEVRSWFEKSFKDDIDKSKLQGSDLYQDVMDSFSEVRNSFVALEAAKFNGGERIHAAANMIKDSFVKKAYPIIANIERASKEVDMSYSGLDSFRADASKTLESLKSTTPKQAVLISRYFKKQSDPIVTRMKETGDKIDALKRWLDEDVMLRMAEDLKNREKEQLSNTDQLKSLEKRKEEIKKEIRELREKKQEKESGFLELLKGKKWEEFNTLNKELKNVKNEILKIEYELTNEISPMKRPLKKLEHTLKKQDILFNHKGFLKGFLQDPFGSVKTKSGEDTLRRFLFTMNKMVHDRKIDLKDKEMEKLDSLMEKMVKDIPEMKRKYNELIDTKDHMEKTIKELSDTVKNKQNLEGEIERTEKDISNIENEAKETVRDQEKLKEKMEKERKDMEKLILKRTGREVEIVG